MLTACAAHRYCNIADMTPEQRGNRIAIFGVVLEYCVHGEWLMSETDENGRWGAWWVPLRKMVKDCGKEGGRGEAGRVRGGRCRGEGHCHGGCYGR